MNKKRFDLRPGELICVLLTLAVLIYGFGNFTVYYINTKAHVEDGFLKVLIDFFTKFFGYKISYYSIIIIFLIWLTYGLILKIKLIINKKN